MYTCYLYILYNINTVCIFVINCTKVLLNITLKLFFSFFKTFQLSGLWIVFLCGWTTSHLNAADIGFYLYICQIFGMMQGVYFLLFRGQKHCISFNIGSINIYGCRVFFSFFFCENGLFLEMDLMFLV